MKTVTRWIGAALCASQLCGCAMMNKEDQDFYGSGWVSPKSLDERLYNPTAHPETTGGLAVPIDSPTVPARSASE